MEISTALARADAALAFLLPRDRQKGSLIGFISSVLTAVAAGIYLYRIWQEYQGKKDEEDRAKFEKKCDRDISDPAEALKTDLIAILRQHSTEQQIRHREQISMLKSVLVALADQKEGRRMKLAGGIQVDSVMIQSGDQVQETAQEQNLSTPQQPSSSHLISQVRDSNCHPTVCMVIQNILAHPEDDRYRKIQLSNPRFKSKISAGPGLEVLLNAGFVQLGDVLVFEDRNLEKLEKILVELESVPRDA